ncbi:MAG: hypothetical protein KKH88_05060 [Nanoarchaeota archaeon]|nr:hypothetical protein [Nanoarchaeota archaeon]
MIKVLSYKRGKFKKADFNKLNLIREMCWIDVVSPDSNELKKISNKLGVSIIDLENSLDKREVPRIFNRKDYSGFIFRASIKNNTLPFGMYLGKKFVLTVRNPGIKSINQFSTKIQKRDNSAVFDKEIPDFVYNLLSSVVKEFSIVLDEIENKLEILENKTIGIKEEDPIEAVFVFKRNLLLFRRSLNENKEVVSKIESNELKFLQQKNQILFSNLHVEINQLINIAELYRERTISITDLHISNISNRLNDVMKSFSVIAALLLLPTLLSGIWGMNFARIPWYDHPYGFYFPIILMLLSMILLFIFFKAKKWI